MSASSESGEWEKLMSLQQWFYDYNFKMSPTLYCGWAKMKNNLSILEKVDIGWKGDRTS